MIGGMLPDGHDLGCLEPRAIAEARKPGSTTTLDLSPAPCTVPRQHAESVLHT